MHTADPLIPARRATPDELPPTYEAYGEFQFAYEHFNRELWESRLPHCLITLQRKSRYYGYFAANRFARFDGRPCDEIALNPSAFARRPFLEVASVLVHEMVHLWQQHFGKPSRRCYHNKQWAGEMKRVGLHPSDTGAPGGKETGNTVRHYIIAGGPFHVAAMKLAETPLAFSWGDAPLRWRLGRASEDDGRGQAGVRVKFTCPACQANAWGKSSLKLLCRSCNRPMLASGETEVRASDHSPSEQLALADLNATEEAVR
jgi:hypothetical protein